MYDRLAAAFVARTDTKKDKNGLIYIALYAYDNIIIRDEKAIEETTKAAKKAKEAKIKCGKVWQ